MLMLLLPSDIIGLFDQLLDSNDHLNFMLTNSRFRKALGSSWLRARVDAKHCVQYGFVQLYWLHSPLELYYHAYKQSKEKALKEIQECYGLDFKAEFLTIKYICKIVKVMKRNLRNESKPMHVRDVSFNINYHNTTQVSQLYYPVDQPNITIKKLGLSPDKDSESKDFQFLNNGIDFVSLMSGKKLDQKLIQIMLDYFSSVPCDGIYTLFNIITIAGNFNIDGGCAFIRELDNYNYLECKLPANSLAGAYIFKLSLLRHPELSNTKEALTRVKSLLGSSYNNIKAFARRSNTVLLTGSTTLRCIQKNANFIPNDINIMCSSIPHDIISAYDIVSLKRSMIKANDTRLQICDGHLACIMDFHFALVRCYFDFHDEEFYLTPSCIVGIIDRSLGHPKCLFKGKSNPRELVDKYEARGFKLPEEHREWYNNFEK